MAAVSGRNGPAGTVEGVGSPGNPQRYVPTATGNNARFHDTEIKILNRLANDLGPASSSWRGGVNLHSELPVCPSCASVIEQFRRDFPNIAVNVTEGKVK
jgi:hypothetical protein